MFTHFWGWVAIKFANLSPPKSDPINKPVQVKPKHSAPHFLRALMAGTPQLNSAAQTSESMRLLDDGSSQHSKSLCEAKDMGSQVWSRSSKKCQFIGFATYWPPKQKHRAGTSCCFHIHNIKKPKKDSCPKKCHGLSIRQWPNSSENWKNDEKCIPAGADPSGANWNQGWVASSLLCSSSFKPHSSFPCPEVVLC